mmetsp:Transcript_27111/g.76287  ORF Transcript_27111/g.76287 Transcript_27111/m.76287 type:complete len:232 (-) Transcript_27111:1367-2062(-)
MLYRSVATESRMFLLEEATNRCAQSMALPWKAATACNDPGPPLKQLAKSRNVSMGSATAGTPSRPSTLESSIARVRIRFQMSRLPDAAAFGWQTVKRAKSRAGKACSGGKVSSMCWMIASSCREMDDAWYLFVTPNVDISDSKVATWDSFRCPNSTIFPFILSNDFEGLLAGNSNAKYPLTGMCVYFGADGGADAKSMVCPGENVPPPPPPPAPAPAAPSVGGWLPTRCWM